MSDEPTAAAVDVTGEQPVTGNLDEEKEQDEEVQQQQQQQQQQHQQRQSSASQKTEKRSIKLVNDKHVAEMINLQTVAIDRLESTNKGLANCNVLAQRKLASTTKLFKKTSKQMSEAKKDLDIIYKKLSDLKAKIAMERKITNSQRTGSNLPHENPSLGHPQDADLSQSGSPVT